ncbi:MAG: S-layer protein, partial [Planctomycetaceae bacterium]
MALSCTRDRLRGHRQYDPCDRFYVLMFLLLGWITPAFAGDSYDLVFSTYFGGGVWEHARDVFADANGNVYVCGGAASHDFPTTAGACDQTFNFGDTSGEECDVFVCKFGPDGQLIWSTFLGGPGYDRAYGIEVDAQGYVYVAGRAGRDFPTTPDTFQPAFQGYNGGGYGGYQNAFVAKLSPDGSTLLWASYVGVAQLCRDIAIDSRGDIYLPLGNPN